VLHVAPPLTITDEQLDEAVATIDAAVSDLEAAHATAR
jgi:4-aminobutyrate aminotransferase-like enzyme